MKLYLGEFEHTLDDRGRITLPRKIRAEIGEESIVVSRGFDTCIFGYDRTSWEREAQKHLEMPIVEQEARNIRRYLFSAAEVTEIDKLGRVLVPTPLKEYGKIEKDVVVVGAGDHFEIWDKDIWKVVSGKLQGV